MKGKYWHRLQCLYEWAKSYYLQIYQIFNLLFQYMSQNLRRWSTFRDEDFQNYEDIPEQKEPVRESGYQFQDNKQNINSTIQDPQIGYILTSRSLKLKQQNQDISFELDFLNQHEQAFKKQQQNFMECTFINKQKHKLGFDYLQNFCQRDDNPKKLTLKQERQFKKDLQTEQKLKDFLRMVESSSSPLVVHQLRYLAFLAWEKYIQIASPLLSKEELIEIAQKYAQSMSQKLFEESQIKFLNLEVVDIQLLQPRQKIKMAFSKFISFYFTTILLVIEEYFENPYFQQKQIKRQRQFYEPLDFGQEPSSQDSSNFYFGSIPRKRFFNGQFE